MSQLSMMTRIFAVIAAVYAVLPCDSLDAADSSKTRKPNVLIILTDDQGWGDLSVNGNTNLSTPNIDSLARDGASFDRFYVCPVCSPTRAEFLTGRYHARSNVYSTSAGGERMNLDEMTIAQTFKAAGYATAAFGKWHNGMQFPYHPNARGFDEFYGFCSGHWGNYFDPMLERNNEIVTGKGFCIDDFTNHAMDFVEENKDKPFFAYLPYNTPHSPMQVPERFWKKFKDNDLELHNRDSKKENMPHVRAALAMCENIDWNVGRILKKLDDLKIADNTIVIYFCDNGPNGVRWNGGMKGRKGSTDEGGVRSPMLIRWPARIKAGHPVNQLGAAIDLLPTLADLTDIPVASTKPLDGISLKSAILTGKNSAPERRIISQWKGKVSVRTNQFRLDNNGKLFDMQADPGQYKDVTKKQPEASAELKKALADYQATLPKDYGKDNRPFVIGHPDAELTQIPARDGTAHGNIKRSNRFPNCSYFTNWTSVEDSITWEAEVGKTGKYRVDLYYSCPQADIGSTIELSFNDSRLSGEIVEPHDPPIEGAEHDRVKRQESYVKDFQPMTLGIVRLEKGTGTLTLKATKLAGLQAMDFRLLMLKRVD
jgi:arylsulfatase A-like enzyme